MLSIPADHRGRQLLHCVLADIETLAWMSAVPDESASDELLGYRCFGVRYRPADWFGRWLSAAERRAQSRALARLEARGLMVRITARGRDRVAFVQPTAAGLRLALSLAGPAADHPAIAQSLSQTDWGKSLFLDSQKETSDG